MDYIEWNYIQAKRQAARLEEQADRLNRLAFNQLEGTLGNLSYNWRGNNAGAYMRKGDRMKSEIGSLSRELRRTAAVIRSSAERTYRAEMRARELARKRTYK